MTYCGAWQPGQILEPSLVVAVIGSYESSAPGSCAPCMQRLPCCYCSSLAGRRRNPVTAPPRTYHLRAGCPLDYQTNSAFPSAPT
jgi:hypothetical protein